jgi:threonine dehydrogenase-like Zn-dependent dehydrogenase
MAVNGQKGGRASGGAPVAASLSSPPVPNSPVWQYNGIVLPYEEARYSLAAGHFTVKKKGENMRGIVFHGDRELAIEEFPDPTPGPDEVIIEMGASGMCGSDLHTYRAPRGSAAASLGLGGGGGPVIAGHEPCGVVVAQGSAVTDRQAQVGQRVMVFHYHGCGVCQHCRQGWSQMCVDGAAIYGITAHGAHAPYMAVPATTLVPLPEKLSFQAGAAISCGAGTAYAALRRMGVSGGATLAIFGQGPVGLAATMMAAAMGVRVAAIDISPERLALAQEFGATWTVNSQIDPPVEAIQALTRRVGVDYALDCSGAPRARVAAVRACRAWATVCFVGEGGSVTLEVSQDLLRKQLTLLGSWTFSIVGQAECARFVADNQIPLDRLFTHRFSLEEAAHAYQLFDSQTMGKGVFVFE